MVAKGTFVRVEYEAVTEDGTLFDTTSAETAKKHDAYNERIVYEALPVVVGAGRVLPGFDRALEEAKVGEESKVTIPPAEAFGAKDANRVETMPLREFQKRDVAPYPGLRVQLENRTGTVVSVTPGRVRVDFNHPFAGKSITYTFKVVEEIKEPEPKVRALVDMDYGQGRASSFGVKVDGETVELALPDSCKYDQRWFVAKYRLVSDLRQWLGAKTVRLVETYDDAPFPDSAHDHEGHEHAHDEGEKKALVEEEML